MITQQFWCTFISVYDTFLALLRVTKWEMYKQKM